MTDLNTVHVFFVYDDYPPNPHDGVPTSNPIGYVTWLRHGERADMMMHRVFDFDANDSGSGHSIANVDALIEFTGGKMPKPEAIGVVSTIYMDVHRAMVDQPQNWGTPARASSLL